MEKKYALLIDAENADIKYLDNIFNELSINKISEIIYSNVIDVIKQFMLENELIRLDIDNIDESNVKQSMKAIIDIVSEAKAS